MPPNSDYRAVFYAPSTNSSMSYLGATGPSGNLFEFEADRPVLGLADQGGFDGDGDGLPDVGEEAIGTDPDSRRHRRRRHHRRRRGHAGAQPARQPWLPDRRDREPAPARVGARASPWTATACTSRRVPTAWLSSDGARFDQPDPAGPARPPGQRRRTSASTARPASQRSRPAPRCELVDVSDPMAPTVARSVAAPASLVEVAGGFAYVTSVTSIRVVDLATGADRPRGHAARVRSDHRPRTRPGHALTRTSAAATCSRPSTSASPRRRPCSVSSRFRSHRATSACSPATTSSGSPAAACGPSMSATRLVPGSSTAPTTSSPRAGSRSTAPDSGCSCPTAASSIELYDVSDPGNTDGFLTRFALSASRAGRSDQPRHRLRRRRRPPGGRQLPPVRSPAVSAPPVSLTTPVEDADPAAPGIQVLERQRIPVVVDVSDDVQVRSVDLLVDGQRSPPTCHIRLTSRRWRWAIRPMRPR